jgi:hypothetical protein
MDQDGIAHGIENRPAISLGNIHGGACPHLFLHFHSLAPPAVYSDMYGRALPADSAYSIVKSIILYR